MCGENHLVDQVFKNKVFIFKYLSLRKFSAVQGYCNKVSHHIFHN